MIKNTPLAIIISFILIITLHNQTYAGNFENVNIVTYNKTTNLPSFIKFDKTTLSLPSAREIAFKNAILIF